MKFFLPYIFSLPLILSSALTAQTQSVFLVPYTSDASIRFDISIPLEIVSREIENTFQTQNIGTNHSINILPPDRARAIMFSRSDDRFGILYSISAQISQTNFSRLINLQAQGELYDISSGRFLTSFRVPAPETISVALSETQCGSECVNNAVASASAQLAREVGFVLSQKLHFIRQDEGRFDSLDINSIRRSLSSDNSRTQLLERIDSFDGSFTIDRNRSIDIEVYFNFDSAELTETAKNQLIPLGEALSQSILQNQKYLISGHTDAKGSAEYNQGLSKRRAESVRSFIVQNYSVNSNDIIAIGLGESMLKSPTDPYGAINRRVEISVLSAQPNLEQSTSRINDYTIFFNLLPRMSVMNLTQALERERDYQFELLQSSETQRVYSLRTEEGLFRLEARLLSSLEEIGISRRNVRMATSGQKITIEALN